MSDDSFIREVEEELRSERLRNFWDKYGKLIIAAAAVIIIGIGSWRAYEWYTATQAAKAGDAFMNAVRLSDEGKKEEALAALKQLETGGGSAYQTLSRLRIAAEQAAKGDVPDAIKTYDSVAADNSADTNLRSIARLRAGILLVDTGTTTEVEARVGQLTGPTAPYRFSAHEALGLSYFKAGDLENAFKQFDTLIKDADTPTGLRQRVRIMLAVIASRGGPKSE